MQGSLSVPFHTTPGLHQLAKLLFRVFGWKTEGVVAQPARFVIIAAPHTSNWDAVVMVTAAYIFGVKLSWFIKDAAFFFPLGMIVRFFGGIPIDRSRRNKVVDQAIERFQDSEQLILAVPPEGTRKHSTHWKTGFYHIARGAGVPIVLGYVDYKRKVAGLGPAFTPTGDIEADFEVFQDFYAKVTPRHPEQRGAVTLAPGREAGTPE
jgi:1-acyl-sn-glycerol-3-phosphate acyltransferase